MSDNENPVVENTEGTIEDADLETVAGGAKSAAQLAMEAQARSQESQSRGMSAAIRNRLR